MLAQALIIQDQQVLMVRQHVRRGDIVWNFPGGQIESGESPEQACIREVQEETGYQVEIMQLIIQSESKYSFAARIVGGSLFLDKNNKDNEDIIEIAWVAMDDEEKWDNNTRLILNHFLNATMYPGYQDRLFWLNTMEQIARPVLTALSERKLKATMPVQSKTADRAQFTHLEALGRLLCGIAPWLEGQGGEAGEQLLRQEFRELARCAVDAGTNPASPDFMNFKEGLQPIVDAAFLAHAILRAPEQLWSKLEVRVKENVLASLAATRSRKPAFSNWLFFAAIIEAALYQAGMDWDPMRIDYALKQHEQWYVGDGTYGDGPHYHWDYYNSFVIQPMLLDLLETMHGVYAEWDRLKPMIESRAKRYASVQERLISPEGTFPPIGRSLAYRFGAFQLLAQMSLREQLASELVPAQVRCGLTAVIRRTIETPGMFDDKGWLRIGFTGDQPEIGETYISTGSLYLCTAVFLPLGLVPSAVFWQGEPTAWTAKKAWAGQPFSIDHAVD